MPPSDERERASTIVRARRWCQNLQVRRLTLIQDIALDLDEHWRLFTDDAFDEKLYLEGFGFPHYEVLERRENDNEVFRRIRVTPKLDLPGPVAKLFGARFAYTDDQTFDKRTQGFRSRVTPGVLSDRIYSESVIRAEPAGAGKCRRSIEITVEARVFGLGGLVESSLEKNLRTGWGKAEAYMNAHAAKSGA